MFVSSEPRQELVLPESRAAARVLPWRWTGREQGPAGRCVWGQSSRHQTAGTRKKMQLRLPGYIKQFTHVSLSKQFCGDLHVFLTCFHYHHIPWIQPVWRRADFPLVALYHFWGRYQLILTKGFILTALLDLLFCTGSFFPGAFESKK